MTPMSLFLNLAPSQTVNLVKITLIQYPIFRIIDRYHTYKITIENLSTDISSGICRYLHIYKFINIGYPYCLRQCRVQE
jgi:hypothetical protein